VNAPPWIDPATILSWGRVDPYLVWAERSRYAGMPVERHFWIPLLVECDGPTEAEVLAVQLRALVRGGGLRIAPLRGLARFTVYVARPRIEKVAGELSRLDVRWELGLPFKSTDFRPEALPQRASVRTPERPRSNRQVVGFIDYGCAFAHAQFREWSGPGRRTWNTRVFALWDQGWDGSFMVDARNAGVEPPQWMEPPDFRYGAEWRRVAASGFPGLAMNEYIAKFVRKDGWLDERACYESSGYQPIHAAITHGTHMMDMAAGYPDPTLPPGRDAGPPPQTDIVFVQLPRTFSGQQVSGLLRTYVLDAVHYIFSCAEAGQPVTINLSYGAYAGSHDGGSIVEAALDEAIRLRRSAGGPTDIVIAAGNGADASAHVEAKVPARRGGERLLRLRWGNIPDNPTDQFTEVWLDGAPSDVAQCKVRLIPPLADPESVDWVGPGEWVEDGGPVEPRHMVIWPRQCAQSVDRTMVLLAVAPTSRGKPRKAAPYGEWTLEVMNPSRGTIGVKAWVERDEPVFMTASGPRQARFAGKAVTCLDTLNSLSHGDDSITVGGFIAGGGRQAKYSARGPRSSSRRASKARPEWLGVCEESDAIPGVAAAAVLGSERVRLPGTSVAAGSATRYVVAQRTPTTDPLQPVQPPDLDDDEYGNDCMPRVPTELPRRAKRQGCAALPGDAAGECG
jgi:hypothetical protein